MRDERRDTLGDPDTRALAEALSADDWLVVVDGLDEIDPDCVPDLEMRAERVALLDGLEDSDAMNVADAIAGDGLTVPDPIAERLCVSDASDELLTHAVAVLLAVDDASTENEPVAVLLMLERSVPVEARVPTEDTDTESAEEGETAAEAEYVGLDNVVGETSTLRDT